MFWSWTAPAARSGTRAGTPASSPAGAWCRRRRRFAPRLTPRGSHAREERLLAGAAAAANAETVLRTEAVWMSRQPQGRQAKSQARQARFYELSDAAASKPEGMGTIELEAGSVKASRSACSAAVPPRQLGIKSEQLCAPSTIPAADARALAVGSVVVELQKASLRFGDLTILNDFSYTFSKGERLALVGANGAGAAHTSRVLSSASVLTQKATSAGKTTFTNILRGTQRVDSGSVVIGETVRFGVYEQMAVFENPAQRVADYVGQLAAEAREIDDGGANWNGWGVPQLLEARATRMLRV